MEIKRRSGVQKRETRRRRSGNSSGLWGRVFHELDGRIDPVGSKSVFVQLEERCGSSRDEVIAAREIARRVAGAECRSPRQGSRIVGSFVCSVRPGLPR